LLSAYFFKERLNLVRVTGILLSVTGAVVVISRGRLGEILGEGLGLGEIYILVCVLSWVTFSLIGKTVLSGLSPLVSIAYSSLVGTVALFFPAYLEGLAAHLSDYSALDWLNILYLGIFGTVVGFIWYYEGIRAIGPGKARLFINFVPVSAIILAFFILQEPVTFSLLVGAVMVSTGVYLTNSHLRRKPAPAVPG
ncbi:MAG: DMT family transporter, partial [Thermodesulfobacteriota bacterium]